MRVISLANILDKIIADKRVEIEYRQSQMPLEQLKAEVRGMPKCRNFYKAVTKRNSRGLNVIAEVKKASPSAGLIRADFDPVAIAQTYQNCGADAVSVLTDEKYFQGRLEYIKQIKQAVDLPVLRKDFIIDCWQVYESRAAGADAILLIADVLKIGELANLMIAAAELTLTVLLEVHQADTLLAVRSLIGFPQKGYSVLGINNCLILVSIGLVMGVMGGLLGIGGSIVMIPAMIVFFKGNQHLYQAAAMICNFFVAISAVLVHKRAKILVLDVIKWLVPAGLVGIVMGVWLSNVEFFAGENSRNLTRVFGCFVIYVAIYNIFKFGKYDGGQDGLDLSQRKKSSPLALLTGLFTGISGGLLGIGGGTICTPMQQICLKMPLKRAISNSSALIASTALAGAFYKNITLAKHDLAAIDSLSIAIIIIPTAMLGAFIGGRLMHKLPRDFVRVVFIGLLVVAAYKLLTVK